MATHNYVRLVGFLRNNPEVNPHSDDHEQYYFSMRVVNREVDGYPFEHFQDILVFYDGEDLKNQIKSLKAYDLIDLSGVINVLSSDKWSQCPKCGEWNVRAQGTYCFVYPIFIRKIDNLETTIAYSEKLPERILENHYKEVSNRCTVMGVVVTMPEIAGSTKVPNCRYRMAVDRKYYIPTQDDLILDYPYVYSFGKQAKNDMMFVCPGALVMVDGFMRYREVQSDITCAACGEEYKYQNVATEIVPFNGGVEYLRNYNDKEVAKEIEANLENTKWKF